MAESTQFLESSKYTTKGLRGCHNYVLPRVFDLCSDLPPRSRVLDVGCGNGSVASEFAKRGCSVVGIDMAEAGIQIARDECPSGRFEVMAADSNVLENLGESEFDLVYSLEVIEHLYAPRSFMAGCFAATRSGGQFICSTPYHGYLKNLMISAADGWDRHADPLFDGGHIKLFSRRKLCALMEEMGFRNLQFRGAGRFPYAWKGMIISGTKP
jgi:2-polyprenyl-3-methyl-5-hydroxy-6-metoxy-1,4-benzoquinol methylase